MFNLKLSAKIKNSAPALSQVRQGVLFYFYLFLKMRFAVVVDSIYSLFVKMRIRRISKKPRIRVFADLLKIDHRHSAMAHINVS